MKIVAAYDLGKLGAAEGKPVLVQWGWFDGKPTLPLWILLAAFLIVPQQNRKWQAWLILVIPLLAIALRLFYFIPTLGSSAEFDLLIQLIVTFAIAWASVWLLAPYFSTGTRRRAFGAALAIMLAVGVAGYVAYFGFWTESGTPGTVLMFWLTGSLSLLFALTLSGTCSRKRFAPGMIAAWMLLWLRLFTVGAVVTMFVASIAIGGGIDIVMLGMFVPMLAISGAILSAFLYAVNLPVLILAGTTDCYRQRLRAMVHRGPIVQSPFAEVSEGSVVEDVTSVPANEQVD